MIDNLLSLKVPGQDEPITPPPNFITPSPEIGLAGIIQWIIIIAVAVGIIAALIFLLWGAIKWITSGGDKDKVANARNTILFSIIGLIVVLLSVVIIQFIGGILGVNVFNLPESEPQPNTRQKSKWNYQPYPPCPDGSGRYHCYDAPNDTYGGCPVCSFNCDKGGESLAYCSVEDGKPGGCYNDHECTGQCPLKKRAVPFCDNNGPDTLGTCKTNCIDIEPGLEY